MGGARTELFAQWLQGNLVIADQGLNSGKRWFVDSTSTNNGATGGYGRSPDKPFDTILPAITAAAEGDRIYVMRGHVEDIADAVDFLVDCAGLEIIGQGGRTTRPTFTFTAAAGTLGITAADITIKGIKLVAGFATGVTAGVTIAATGDGATIEDVIFADSAADTEFLKGISIAALTTDVTIRRCFYSGIPGESMSSFIYAVGAADYLTVEDCFLVTDCSGSVIDALTAASVGVHIENNRITNIDTSAGLGIGVHASTTGIMSFNHVAGLKNTVYGLIGAGCAYHENYCSNALTASGVICPAVDNFPS